MPNILGLIQVVLEAGLIPNNLAILLFCSLIILAPSCNTSGSSNILGFIIIPLIDTPINGSFLANCSVTSPKNGKELYVA